MHCSISCVSRSSWQTPGQRSVRSEDEPTRQIELCQPWKQTRLFGISPDHRPSSEVITMYGCEVLMSALYRFLPRLFETWIRWAPDLTLGSRAFCAECCHAIAYYKFHAVCLYRMDRNATISRVRSFHRDSEALRTETETSADDLSWRLARALDVKHDFQRLYDW